MDYWHGNSLHTAGLRARMSGQISTFAKSVLHGASGVVTGLPGRSSGAVSWLLMKADSAFMQVVVVYKCGAGLGSYTFHGHDTPRAIMVWSYNSDTFRAYGRNGE